MCGLALLYTTDETRASATSVTGSVAKGTSPPCKPRRTSSFFVGSQRGKTHFIMREAWTLEWPEICRPCSDYVALLRGSWARGGGRRATLAPSASPPPRLLLHYKETLSDFPDYDKVASRSYGEAASRRGWDYVSLC